ncbi:MAG: thiamine diphosphokinase [Bifidobacteriaceae bacterium]|nr:thiamine diphosphokinase [Bifidobacteriaceae bacterium]
MQRFDIEVKRYTFVLLRLSAIIVMLIVMLIVMPCGCWEGESHTTMAVMTCNGMSGNDPAIAPTAPTNAPACASTCTSPVTSPVAPSAKRNACVVLGAGEYYGTEAESLRLAGLRPGATDTAPLIIAADGGLDHAAALGITPDFVIGDFDSVASKLDIAAITATAAADTANTSAKTSDDTSNTTVNVATRFATQSPAQSALAPYITGILTSGPFAGTPVITLPSQKDDADMMSALKAGWTAGAREFHILGGLGGRLDHTLGNVQLLTFVSRAGGTAFLYGDRIAATAVTDGSVRFPAMPVPRFPMVSVFSAGDESHGVRIEGLKYEVSDFTISNDVAQLSNELIGIPATISVERGTLIITYPAAIAPPAVKNGVRPVATLGELSTHVSDRLRG